MSSTPSYVGVAGICSVCMHLNVEPDWNCCQKNIMAGACDLCAPNHLYTITYTEYIAQRAQNKLETKQYAPT